MKRIFLPLAVTLILAACAGQAAPAASVAPASNGTTAGASSKAAASLAPSASASASLAPSGSASSSVASPASSQPSSSGPASSSASPSASGSASASSEGSSNAAVSPLDQLREQAIEQVSPGVVQITHPVQQGGRQGTALGSGSIIDSDGHILTNAHVAAGTTTYQVTLANGKTLPGKLIGLDEFDDLAVIQINQPNLPVVQMGDSSALRVGQTVLAIGNPIGYTQTVTEGIVSALDRTITEPPSPVTGQQTTIPNMIQISTPINPGNSGGALIDLSGKIVGVPTLAAIDPELNQQAVGIAFAVPINRAKVIIPQLIQNGKITHSGRAFLGIAAAPITPGLARAYGLAVNQGLYLAQVVPNSGAAQAGLKQGDIIVSIDGKPVRTQGDLQDELLQKKPGDKVTISYYEGNQQKTVTATLQEAPANQG